MPGSFFKALGDDGNDLFDFTAYQNLPLDGNGNGGVASSGNWLFGGAGDGHAATAGIPNVVDGGFGNDHVAAAAGQPGDHAAAAAAAPSADPNAVIVIPGTHNLVIDGLHQSGEYFLV
jgi:hypothetical protein